jgi:hypothetical protein
MELGGVRSQRLTSELEDDMKIKTDKEGRSRDRKRHTMVFVAVDEGHIKNECGKRLTG